MASGLFGIGGGAIIVPILITAFGFEQKKAAGISLIALLAPVGLPGAILYSQAGKFELVAAALVAFGLLTGAVFGAKISIGLPPKIVKRLYGFFLLFIAISFIF